MGPIKFTDEQVEKLSENPYTDYVSKSNLRFTMDFREMFIRELQSGKKAREIFAEAGYDVSVLGESRIKSASHRIRKEFKVGDESPMIHKKNSAELPDYTEMTQKEAIARMQHEIRYLHQELEFIKKLSHWTDKESRRYD